MSGAPYTSPGREHLLQDLNPAQRQAVIHGLGPLLIVAGAGTGKTRVLTRRVAWLIAGGLPASAVLAITFTNKAANVLKERIADLLVGRRVWAGTFHGFCALMLRIHGEAIGVSPDYTILDRDDQRRILRDLLADIDGGSSEYKPAEVGAMISHVKNGGGGRAPLDLSDPDERDWFRRILQTYTNRLRAGNLLDFDDLLLRGLRLLKDVEEVREHYQRRFAHVLVDEYQDTNRVQAELLEALLGPSQNLTVVGDPDQSIYRWRGAVVRNILDFEKDFPGARKVVLERNYRSTRHILEAAEHVIERNLDRHAKRLYTEKEEGKQLRVVCCRDEDDEAEVVATLIARWQAEGFALGDVAVFYRANWLSRALELGLLAHRIPYVVVAGVEFFRRREVKDLLAYARLVENPQDEAAFLRIVNTPRRGVGDTSVKKLRRAAIHEDISSFEAARRKMGGVSGRALGGLTKLIGLVDEARALPSAPVAPLLERLAEVSGYNDWLARQDDVVETSRAENIGELIAFAHDWDQREGGDLRFFLERTALVSDQDAFEDDAGRVSLMSVHAAKGLEFPCVVIVGAEDELFPHARSIEDMEGVEEERRLFYVAMTRAETRLAITHVAIRHAWQSTLPRRPSPYLADIPHRCVEMENRLQRSEPLGSLGFDLPGEDDPDVVCEAGGDFAPGDRVRHPYFGEGWLADRHGRGLGTRVTVDFDGFGRKQLLLTHARLERLS